MHASKWFSAEGSLAKGLPIKESDWTTIRVTTGITVTANCALRLSFILGIHIRSGMTYPNTVIITPTPMMIAVQRPLGSSCLVISAQSPPPIRLTETRFIATMIKLNVEKSHRKYLVAEFACLFKLNRINATNPPIKFTKVPAARPILTAPIDDALSPSI